MSLKYQQQGKVRLQRRDGYWLGGFDAMASPCEVLLACEDRSQAQQLVEIAAQEAWRIERKYSRYRDDSVVSQINHSNGKAVSVDSETAQLLDFAFQCYQLSDGLFDITCGVMRKVWIFDGSDRIPLAESVSALLPLIGLNKTSWENKHFTLPQGMEIDLGGIGKEYAVDRALLLLQEQANIPVLLNFGGDIATNRCRLDSDSGEQKAWLVGIEKPGSEEKTDAWVEIRKGGLATSGDARRFLLKDGKRYSHVINPLSGWPVEQAPRSVTVAAATCTQAGILATMAMLQGAGAESFLKEQDVRYWII